VVSRKVLMISTDYYGTEKSIARAFERNGVETILVNSRMNSWERIMSKLTRLFPGTKILLNYFIKATLEKENERYISIARTLAPAFVFIVKGDSLFPETLRYFKNKLNIPSVSYQWDDPFPSFSGTAGGNAYRDGNFQQGISYYDHVFVYDRYYVEKMLEMGINSVSYLPLAADDEIYRKADLTREEKEKYGYDVCFVGMPYENRIDILNSLEGFNVGVFGDLWERYKDKIDGDYFKGKASGDTVQKIYGASKIVLNINHPQSKYGVNTRTFEIPACEAFGIFDHIEGIEDLFDIGEEIVCYRSTDELKSLIRYYLDHPEERDAIVRKGHKRVMQEHTWFDRVKKIIEVVN